MGVELRKKTWEKRPGMWKRQQVPEVFKGKGADYDCRKTEIKEGGTKLR